MRNCPPVAQDPMADGISIRVRVRRASCIAKLEYGEHHDMVCTIVNGEISRGSKRRQESPPRPSLFRRSTGSHHSISSYGKVSPTLFFHTRTSPGHTLETCCSLQSVSSYDSMDPSVNSLDKDTTNPLDVSLSASQRSQRFTSSTNTYPMRANLSAEASTKRKKKYAVPCNGIIAVEKTASLFRGYRIVFTTDGTRGSYELEFENKNGMDIMMAFLQATLPPERFINADCASSPSKDVSDSASYLSSLDVEKLTERLAERETSETMSERLRRSVGQMVSSIEEISDSLCSNVCCHGQLMGASVAPYVPPDEAQEIRDSPPSPVNNTTTINFQGYMEMAEEKSLILDESAQDDKKRLFLREHKLPSGLSVEMPE